MTKNQKIIVGIVGVLVIGYCYKKYSAKKKLEVAAKEAAATKTDADKAIAGK